MAVRIPGPDSVDPRRASNQRTVVGVEADPIGRVFENLGERGRQIAQGLREQQIDTEVLTADMEARRELDALRREIETGDDASVYEQQFQARAEPILQNRGRAMAFDARGVWERRSAELMNAGALAVRESAQRRVMDDARASIRTASEDAVRIIRDPNSDDNSRAAAIERATTLSRRSVDRRLITADDGAQFDAMVADAEAERQRTVGLVAASQQGLDAIFSRYDTWGERLAAIREVENPVLRERMEDDAAQRQTRDDVARGELLDQAYGHIAAGERVPQELFARLAGRDQVRLQDYIRERNRSIAAGSEVPIDRARVSDLTVMAADRTRRNEFLAVDLQGERGRLGETAYARLRQFQDALRNGDELPTSASQETINGALRIGRNQLRAAGFEINADGNLSADADEADQQNMIEFQADLIGMMERFVDENGRQPTAQEQLNTIQSMLAVREGLGRGGSDMRAYQTYTRYDRIPAAERQRIERILREEGQPVTRGNVERLYELQTVRRLRSERAN